MDFLLINQSINQSKYKDIFKESALGRMILRKIVKIRQKRQKCLNVMKKKKKGKKNNTKKKKKKGKKNDNKKKKKTGKKNSNKKKKKKTLDDKKKNIIHNHMHHIHFCPT